MNRNLYFLVLLLLFSKNFSQQKSNDFLKVKDFDKQKKWVDSIYQNLSLDEKLGQLFNVAIYTNKDENHIQSIRELVVQEKIGGLIIMQDDAKKHIEIINEFQKKSKVPLLIGIDAEWGLAQRIKNTPFFPFAMTLGALQDNKLIYEMAKQIAQDCKLIGVHWNFSPVVDINTNPLNPIIGGRSFSSDRLLVVNKSLAYMNGLQDQNILSSAKHFPGHGDTEKDSHKFLPQINHQKDRLEKIELFPYKELTKKGLSGIMVGHLQVTVFEKDEKIPASLSYNIITNILKNEMNYKGLIITDALNMEGVAKNFPHGEIDLRAFKAGNDILLFSQAVKIGKEKIKNALINNEISEQRLEESVKKILKAKYFVGLNKFQPLDSTKIYEKLNSIEHNKINEEIYKKAITIVKNDQNNLPFSVNNQKIVHLVLEGNEYKILEQKLNNFSDVKTIKIDEIKTLSKDNKVIISILKDTKSVYNSYKISKTNLNIINKIAKSFDTTLVIYASPYSLIDMKLDKLKSVVMAYQNNEYTQNIVPQILFGKLPSLGKLPVNINNEIIVGTGVFIP